MDNLSAGDAGGIAAAALVAGNYLLKFLRWLTGWADSRRRAEDKRLAEWQTSLDRREKDHRAEIEAELGEVKAEVEATGRQQAVVMALLLATRTALHEVTVKLRQHDPECVEIEHAEALLRPGFLDPGLFSSGALPSDLAELLAKMRGKKP